MIVSSTTFDADRFRPFMPLQLGVDCEIEWWREREGRMEASEVAEDGEEPLIVDDRARRVVF